MGLGTRYDQPDSLERIDRQRSWGIGFPLKFICPVCGIHRRKGHHDKCSRLMQKQRTERWPDCSLEHHQWFIAVSAIQVRAFDASTHFQSTPNLRHQRSSALGITRLIRHQTKGFFHRTPAIALSFFTSIQAWTSFGKDAVFFEKNCSIRLSALLNCVMPLLYNLGLSAPIL